MADLVVNSTTTSTNSNFRFINSYSKQGLRSSKDTLRRDVRSYVARSVNGGGTNNESGKGGGVIFDVEITSLGGDDEDEDGLLRTVRTLPRKNKRRSTPTKKTCRTGCYHHGRCDTTLLNREDSSLSEVSSEASQSGDPSTNSKSNTPPPTDSSASSAIVTTNNNTTTVPKPNNTILVPAYHHHYTPPAIHRLSTYTSTPIAHLTMYHLPWVKTVVQNYFTNMDIPFPELDDGSPRPVVRTHWLPMCIQHPAIFQVIVCFAATAYAVYQPNYEMLKATVLQVKAQALAYLMREIRGLNERKAALAAAASQRSSGLDAVTAFSIPSSSSAPRLTEDGEVPTSHVPTSHGRQPVIANTSRRRTTTVRAADNIEEDCLIAAVVKMASYEAIFGDAPAYHIHMTFLTHLLSTRSPPGLASLSQDGVLARLLRYVDTNSAHLLNTKLYLVDGEFGGVCLPRQYPLQMRRWSELEAEKVRREVAEGRFGGLCGTGGG